MSNACRRLPSAVVLSACCVCLFSFTLPAKAEVPQELRRRDPALASALEKKAASAALIAQIERSLTSASRTTVSSASGLPAIMAAVYAKEAPSPALQAAYAARGGRIYPETWTPPSQHHPLGFYLAKIPVASLAGVLSLDDVQKMETAESELLPLSNAASRAIKADLVWTSGLSGSGVPIGIIDSGIDVSYAGTELPQGFIKRDYSFYPQIDTIVANTATGHGTHVAGCALGRGFYSASNTANGGGAYRGTAPQAELVFLKVGMDGSGAATDASVIAAIHAAVDSFHVKVINLSYGAWDAYHDGSNAMAQAVDWAYSRGVACFAAAGNFGSAMRHASGFVSAGDTSGFIPVTVGAYSGTLYLAFNLVWSDGAERSVLSLLYYDKDGKLLTDVSRNTTKESPRGTESQFSQYNPPIVNQPGTYFLRVVNRSSVMRQFHLYENFGRGFVQFAAPDPGFTVTSPGDADHAFTVGAFTSRQTWTGMNGGTGTGEGPSGSLSSYSSRGPRVDGELKPNIVAPGTMIISLRDRDVYTSSTFYCVDDDGQSGGDAHYYVMQGTSMASPVCAGAAALLFQQRPDASPQQIYDAIMQHGTSDAMTGFLPNPSWGFGKLNVYGALLELPLPIELSDFSVQMQGRAALLSWRTQTETNNYGFEIERKGPARSAEENAWKKIGFVPGFGTTQSPHEYTLVDRPGASGLYSYRLRQIDRDGRFEYSRVIDVDASFAPRSVALAQNYPNPFNPSTILRFELASAEEVRLSIFDVLGREVALLAQGMMEPGAYEKQWNAAGLPGGMYFCRLKAGPHTMVRRLVLEK
ncbi:MAG: S8 family serine peptidase [Acidobacteriota bacterium]